jgi:hypothetical protein
MSTNFRVWILCEDRRAERLLRGLCQRFDIEVLDVFPAPAGCASAWVLAKYPELVRKRRSKNYQQNLGLLVHVDGDDVGVVARKAALDARLAQVSLSKRQIQEPMALMVPTWCIETWLLHIGGYAEPPESAQVKRDPAYIDAVRRLEHNERQALRHAVASWPASHVPSLNDAAVEARRVGIQ